MNNKFPRFLKWWESKRARNFFNNIFKRKLIDYFKEKDIYVKIRLVGSIKRNTCLVFKDWNFDIDYQIFLNELKHNELEANEIKKDLLELLKSIKSDFNSKNNDCELFIENSTSVFTIKRKCKKNKYSYDLAIISQDGFIIRKNQKNDNQYVWEKSKYKYNELYEKWKYYNNNFEKKEILNIFKDKKIANRNKNDKDSSSLLLESINEYEQQKYKNNKAEIQRI